MFPLHNPLARVMNALAQFSDRLRRFNILDGRKLAIRTGTIFKSLRKITNIFQFQYTDDLRLIYFNNSYVLIFNKLINQRVIFFQ